MDFIVQFQQYCLAALFWPWDVDLLSDSKLYEILICNPRRPTIDSGLAKVVAMAAAVTVPYMPTRAIKSFGALGPKYQVGRPLRQLADGDWMVETLLVETGEKTEYRLSRLNDDPEAR